MILGVLLAVLTQAAAPASPEELAAVQRFIAACVDGQITGTSLRAIEFAELPAPVRSEFRNQPSGRYYRFDERAPSFLVVIPGASPSAQPASVCALAAPAGEPWNVFGGVMASVMPDRPLERVGRYSNTLSASMRNDEEGYAIQATRVGRYTLIQTIQDAPKLEAPSALDRSVSQRQ